MAAVGLKPGEDEGGFKEMIYTVRCVAVCVVVLL